MITDSEIEDRRQNDSSDSFAHFEGKLLTALVVDDEILNTEYLQTSLEFLGFEVYIAHDGDLAIDLCLKLLTFNKPIDLIFMDYSMPTLNGDECTRRLRKPMFDPILKNAKIVGVTAHFDPETKEKCLSSGMTIVEKKPFNYADLQRILKLFEFIPDKNKASESNASISARNIEFEEIHDMSG